MKVQLKSITPNAEINIVEIARVSSSRTDKTEKPDGLINYLINNKHWSPFEHSFLTFEIETSKAIGIQLLRHRSFTFQEFSQRYAKVEEMEPVELRYQAEKNRQSSTDIVESVHLINMLNDTIERCNQTYNKLLESGVAKECARMVLPMCTKTTIYMTGSIRSWIHFLQIRDDGHAQKEIQLIAKDIKSLFISELPIISKALNWTE